MQHSDPCEDVEVVELGGLEVGTVGIALRGFSNELAPGVFIENLETIAN